MNIRKTIAPGLLALTLGAAALPGWAGDECDVPIQRWQSREAVNGSVLLLLLWHLKQALSVKWSAMVIWATFLVSKSFVWQSAHRKPLDACSLPSNMTVPWPPPP